MAHTEADDKALRNVGISLMYAAEKAQDPTLRKILLEDRSKYYNIWLEQKILSPLNLGKETV